MSTFYQTGKLSTPTKLRCIGSGYGNGDWVDRPKPLLDQGFEDAFFKSRLERSFNESNGYVTYMANDGTEFELTFYINSINIYLVKNAMNITNLSGPWAAGIIEHTTGADTTFTWNIVQTSSFYDAPVRAEDILTADKCDLVPRDMIWEYLAGRSKVNLADVLEAENLHPHAKLWCAVHPLFLTSVSKATLTRELAKMTMSELLATSNDGLKHGDDMLALNERMANGIPVYYETNAFRKELDDRCLVAAQCKDARQFELSSTLYGLLDNDLTSGWRKAVSCYIGFATEDELTKRQNTILELIAKKL